MPRLQKELAAARQDETWAWLRYGRSFSEVHWNFSFINRTDSFFEHF